MKGLNKLALATAIAAAPFATQAMEPMSDSQMGDVTGQEGVTIELQTQASMDEFRYSQNDADGGAAGSFLVSNIDIGGLDPVNDTFDASINIDLQENGDALISFGAYNSNPNTGDPVPVMLGVDVGSAGIEGQDGEQATLMTDMTMDMYLTQLDITASTEDLNNPGTRDDANGHLAIDAGFAMDMDADFDVAAVGVRGLTVAGATNADGSAAAATDLSSGAQAALGSGRAPAVANMTIHAGAPSATYTALDQPEEALILSVANFTADVYVDQVRIGGAAADNGIGGATRSIGSVAIDNLTVSNTELAIYGRE